MPMISVSKETKAKIDRLVILDKRTQGNVIDVMCDVKLQEFGKIEADRIIAEAKVASRASQAEIEAGRTIRRDIRNEKKATEQRLITEEAEAEAKAKAEVEATKERKRLYFLKKCAEFGSKVNEQCDAEMAGLPLPYPDLNCSLGAFQDNLEKEMENYPPDYDYEAID